jgi:hypothetical protein
VPVPPSSHTGLATHASACSLARTLGPAGTSHANIPVTSGIFRKVIGSSSRSATRNRAAAYEHHAAPGCRPKAKSGIVFARARSSSALRLVECRLRTDEIGRFNLWRQSRQLSSGVQRVVSEPRASTARGKRGDFLARLLGRPYGRSRQVSAEQVLVTYSCSFPRGAGPNPSLKRSANGGPPGPRGALVYLAPRGPGVPPLSPA